MEDCLTHPYLDAYHDPEDEPAAKPLPRDFFDFDHPKEEINREKLKQLLWVHVLGLADVRYDEVMEFQPA